MTTRIERLFIAFMIGLLIGTSICTYGAIETLQGTRLVRSVLSGGIK